MSWAAAWGQQRVSDWRCAVPDWRKLEPDTDHVWVHAKFGEEAAALGITAGEKVLVFGILATQ